MLAKCPLGCFFDYETTVEETVIQLITMIMRLILIGQVGRLFLRSLQYKCVPYLTNPRKTYAFVKYYSVCICKLSSSYKNIVKLLPSRGPQVHQFFTSLHFTSLNYTSLRFTSVHFIAVELAQTATHSSSAIQQIKQNDFYSKIQPYTVENCNTKTVGL